MQQTVASPWFAAESFWNCRHY